MDFNPQLKIFISSTFEDMQSKRQKLLTEVFIKIKKIAQQREVEVVEIDLRTGIIENNKLNIAQICLEQIDRCASSPVFFLGILGNRYGWDGWYDNEDIESLKPKYKKIIKKYAHASLTELEIRYALSNDKNNKSFFYVAKSDKNEDRRLVTLKKEIKDLANKRKSISFAYYENDQDFADKVYNDLKKELENLYPLKKNKTEVEILRTPHKTFAFSRYKSYIANPENEKILDDFLFYNKEDRLLLYGESGLGKSTLIANYFKKFRDKHKGYFIIEHYIGGSGEQSSDFYAMLRRTILEIKEKFGISDNIPIEQEDILKDFTLWLNKVKKKTIIIWDGYDQIDDDAKKRFLEFFLSSKYKNIKLIITTIKNDYKILNQKRIQKLTSKKKREFISKYMNIYGKKLDCDIAIKILKNKMTDNTLFLRTLLEEIRFLGEYDKLNEEIENYLKAESVEELFIKIFKRYERDYDPNLIKEVLSLLYVSRDGLSESNLLEIIDKKFMVDRYKFYPMIFSLEEHLIKYNGLYRFFHNYIRRAVKQYCFNQDIKFKYRYEIIDYFKNIDINVQKAREVPYQLYKLKDKDKLYKILENIELFIMLKEINEYELLKYIRFLGKKKNKNLINHLVNLCLLKKDFNEENARVSNEIAIFLDVLYYEQEQAKALYKKALKIYKKILPANHDYIITSYFNLANIYDAMGNFKKAEKYYQKLEDITNYKDLSSLYNNLGGHYHESGDYIKSIKYYRKSISLIIKDKKYLDLALVYNNLATTYQSLSKYKTAFFFYEKTLKIRKQYLQDIDPDLAVVYRHLANLYRELEQYKKAYKYYKKALNIDKQIYGKNHYVTSVDYNDLAGYFSEIKNNYKKALKLYKKSLKITKNFLGTMHLETAITYANIGILYADINKNKKAQKNLFYSLKIRKKILRKNHPTIGETYLNIATFFYNIRQFSKAFKYNEKAISIFKKNYNNKHQYIELSKKSLDIIKKELKSKG